MPTKSDWTALFQGSLSGTDEALPDVMSDQLNCDRLMITYDPGKDEVEFGGSSMPGRVFSYSERPAPLGETTRVRNIWAIVEDGWEFGQIGAPLPGESMNSYGAQRVRDRLPFEHVRALCRLVGTRPFDEDFYDVPRHAATIISLDIPPRSNDPELSIDEAQRWNAR